MSEKTKTNTRANTNRVPINERLGRFVLVAAALVGGEQVVASTLSTSGKTVNVPEVIQPQDTIWSAVERADKKMHVSVDPRSEVYRITNQLGTSVVTPGEQIDVHVKK
jgi:hypothetical protein